MMPNPISFELGPMMLSRGFCYLASRDIVTAAAPFLDELRDETSASCLLAIREGIDAVDIEYRVAEKRNKPLAGMTVRSFVQEVASLSSAPGGGSVSAALSSPNGKQKQRRKDII